jgi:ribose transport system substrate-binding protein
MRHPLSAILIGLVLIVGACTNAAAPSVPPSRSAVSEAPTSQSPATEVPATEAPATDAPGTEAPSGNPYDGAVPGSGSGKKVGYISLGDSLPFVKLVSDSIQEQAEIADLELVTCDSQVDQAKALECGRNLNVQGVDAVLNFQAFADSSPEVCAAYGDLPTIAIDIAQEPCQVVFMGADNHLAGEVVGIATGQALEAENGCTYEAVLTLESPQVGEVNEARTGGMLDGFSSQCGEIPTDKLQRLGVGGTTDQAITQVSDALSALPSTGIIVILSLNDDMALGALAAARTAGREENIRIGAQGADPSAWKEIACNPVWVADAAYFPERYGRILVPAIIDILDGKTVPENLFTPHEAITKDNIRTVYPETPAC